MPTTLAAPAVSIAQNVAALAVGSYLNNNDFTAGESPPNVVQVMWRRTCSSVTTDLQALLPTHNKPSTAFASPATTPMQQQTTNSLFALAALQHPGFVSNLSQMQQALDFTIRKCWAIFG
jgi:hypothetical protein